MGRRRCVARGFGTVSLGPNMTEHTAKRHPNRAPTHPGAILREDVLPALGLSVTETARRLHVSRQTLHDLLAERKGFTPETAQRCGCACNRTSTCGTPNASWPTNCARSTRPPHNRTAMAYPLHRIHI